MDESGSRCFLPILKKNGQYGGKQEKCFFTAKASF